jgi:hypothetical protein
MEAPTPPKAPTDDEIVSGYLANYAGDQSAFWAFEETCELLSDDPERLWLITLRLIEQAPDDAALAYVAAGPLEDILAFHGPTFIERVEDLARRDSRFLLALSGVWGQVRLSPEIHARVRAIKANNHPSRSL